MVERLRQARAALIRAGVFDVLDVYTPTIAGTIPLGIDIPGSDVDVLCTAPDADAFVRDALRFARQPRFSLYRADDTHPPAVVCRFTTEGLPVELFAQPIPVTAQRAYRHMVVEGRLLAMAGEGAGEAICALKRKGIKTEPAFAEHFALVGDAYEALLRMADWSDAALAAAVADGYRTRRRCPFCRVVDGGAASRISDDPWTLSFVNRRQANPGHVLVIPRRHIPNVFDLDPEAASALGRATTRAAQALRAALGVTDLSIWQSNGAAAGQVIGHLHVHVFPRRQGDGWFQVYPPGAPPEPRPRVELDALANRIRPGAGVRRPLS